LTTGLGVKKQLTPVGNVLGAHTNAIASPAMPVPALIDIGMLTAPPAGSVLVEGTTIAGAGTTVIWVVAMI
jgi:hypothetical protein